MINWETVSLFDICQPKQWRTIAKKDLKDSGFPIYGANGIIGCYDQYNHAEKTILITCRGATCGQLHISKPFSWVNGNAMSLDNLNENVIDIKFLFLALKNRGFEDTIGGSAQPQITQTGLKKVQVPLPPLNEQRRIVGAIAEMGEKRDRAKQELEAIRPLLKQFRQSVLAAAFRGDLTADWREQNPDIEPAEVLLEKIRVERRQRWEEAELEKMKAKEKIPPNDKWKQKYKEPEAVDAEDLPNLPDGWCWTILENICQKITDGEHITPPLTESGVHLLSAKDVRDGHLDFSNTKFVSEDFAHKSRSRCNPEKRDILVVSRGATVGRTCLIKTDQIFCLMGSVLLFKIYESLIYPDLVQLFFKSPYGINKLYSMSGASAQQAIYIRDMRTFAISVPPLEEQKEIVKRIESLFNLIDNIEQQIQQAEIDLETLNQSILAKAFRGELVPQDPNDEPASVLLERIKTEKEANAPKQKKQTTKKAQKTEQLDIPGIDSP